MNRSKLMMVVMPLTLAACSGSDAGVTPADLVGTWESPACEVIPGETMDTHLTRRFVLTDSTWHLELGLFADPACSVPLWDVVIDGGYELGAPSESVAGATEAEFEIASNVWTPRNADIAALFASSGCGDGTWEVGEGQDVSGTGCLGVAHPRAECPAEHDLVAIDDAGRLRFGRRDVDLCTTRPSALTDFPLARE